MKDTHPVREERGADGTASHDWRVRAQRRWPVAVAGILLVVLAIVALSRWGGGAEATESTESEGGEGRVAEVADTVVTLDSAALRLAEIELAAVGASGASGLVANGTITYDANRVSVVAPRTEGRVVAVRADLGQRIGSGTVLALLESREVGQSRGELERARANLEVAQNNYEREKRLYEQSISSQKEMLEAQGAYKTALAEYNSAVSQISGLGAQTGEGGTYGLTSPIDGSVVERNAMPGQVVDRSTNLFTVADLRRVWITVDVYESDVGRVHPNASAVISPRALPAETFRGRVTYAGGIIDSASHTLKVRVEVDNPGLRLRPGMFAQVRIETPANAVAVADDAMLISSMAVQELNGKSVVFVPSGAPGRFIARHVTVGTRAGGGLVRILSGLTVGDSVVVKGAFQLKAELTKSSFGENEG